MTRCLTAKGCRGCLGVLIYVLLGSTPIHGQGPGELLGEGGANAFIPAPRALRQLLDDADQSIAAEQWSEAVLSLGGLLSGEAADNQDVEDLSGQDFFLDQGDRSQRSLLREAERLIGELPAAGQEVYELTYGSDAQRLLDIAAREGDDRTLAEASRRYFHTKAGYEATFLLGYRRLLAGQPRAAVAIFERLAKAPRARERFDPTLRLLLAVAYRQFGRQSASDEILAQLATEFPRAAVRIGEQQTELPSNLAETRIWMKARFGDIQSTYRTRTSTGLVSRGGPSDVMHRDAGLPLATPRWVVPTVASSLDARALLDTARQQGSRGGWPAPTLEPLAVGDTVLVKTADLLLAIDLKTGKRIWYPWYAASEEIIESAGESDAQDLGLESRRARTMQRVWSDVPYGRVSSDGERVFTLHRLGDVELGEMTGLGFPGRFMGDGSQRSDAGNALVALELASEGKMLWSVGGQLDERPGPLSNAFFLGAPLPLDGQLYALTEQNGDIYLVVLDPATGELQWRQHLLAVESASIANDAIRRIAGAEVAAGDGVLICPTGHGAIVAVDLVTRALRWGMTYERSNRFSPFDLSRGGENSATFLNRWVDGTPLISGGRVVITPVESDKLFCLDLATGEVCWPPRERGEFRQLGGVSQGRIILLGPRSVLGIDLETGQDAWEQPLHLMGDEQVAGRGLAVNGRYLVPTNRDRLLAIDIETGKLIDEKQLAFPLGNLIYHQGQVIAQGIDRVSAAYDTAWLNQEIPERLARSPNDRESLLRRGQLAAEELRLDDALRDLQVAYDLQPDEEARVVLASAMLTALRSDFRRYQSIAPQLEQLCDLPSQRGEFLRLMADNLIDAGRSVDAMQRLVDLSRMLQEDVGVLGRADETMLELSPTHQVQLDAWIAARVEQLAGDPDARNEMNRLVQPLVSEALNGSTLQQQRLLAHFGSLPPTDFMRLALARRLLREENHVAAERLLLDGLSFADEDSARIGPFCMMLAAVSADRQDPQQAKAWLAKAGEPSTELLNEALGANLASSVGLLQKLQAIDDPLLPWREHAQPPVITAEPAQTAGLAADRVAWLARSDGRFQDWDVRVNKRQILIEDGDGLRRAPIGVDSITDARATLEAISDGGLLLSSVPGQLVAVDLWRTERPLSDPVMWQRPLPAAGQPKLLTQTNALRDRRTSYTDADGIALARLGPLQGQQLILVEGRTCLALDALTGTVRWRVSALDEDVVPSGDDAQVALVGRRSGKVTLLSARDGRQTDSYPWDSSDELWHAQGPYLLTVPKDGTNMAVKLRKATSGETVLEAKLSSEARGHVVDGRYAVMLEPDGRLQVWDIQFGRTVADLQVGSVDELRQVRGLRMGPRLLILAEQSAEKAPPEPGKVTTPSGNGFVLVRGLLACVDLRDGNAAWEKPLRLPTWGCYAGAPSHSPLLLFVRRVAPEEPSSTAPLQIMALDVRSGTIVGNPASLNVMQFQGGVNMNFSLSPDNQSVRVELGRHALRYDFKDTPSETADPVFAETPEPGDGQPGSRAVVPVERP